MQAEAPEVTRARKRRRAKTIEGTEEARGGLRDGWTGAVKQDRWGGFEESKSVYISQENHGCIHLLSELTQYSWVAVWSFSAYNQRQILFAVVLWSPFFILFLFKFFFFFKMGLTKAPCEECIFI